MEAVDEEKLQEAFVRVVNRVIEDRDNIVKHMTENVEKAYVEQASAVDVAAIDKRLEELGREMSALVKLNLTAGVNTDVYAVEYNRINSEMDDLRSKRKVVTDAEIMRRETLERVQEIGKALRKMKGVQDFDEELFKMLIEKINVMNRVQVEFVLWAGVGVVEVI